MVMFEAWLESVGEAIGCSGTLAGYIMGLIFTAALMFLMILAKSGFGAFATSFFSTLLFIILGWYPIWVLMILILGAALMYAGKIKDLMGGD